MVNGQPQRTPRSGMFLKILDQIQIGKAIFWKAFFNWFAFGNDKSMLERNDHKRVDINDVTKIFLQIDMFRMRKGLSMRSEWNHQKISRLDCSMQTLWQSCTKTIIIGPTLIHVGS